MSMALARRVLAQGLRQAQRSPAQQQRGMADYHIPKPDASLDHVFGDSTFRVPFDFQPPSMFKTFSLSVFFLGVSGFPIWVMVNDSMKMESFLAQLEAAKAAKLKA
eukprot:CAMPEP_0119102274 /NCGR_PEP_ID=MMETSP1180-20130426/1069_1 /TAXON_ID=3052 ORGANISM="Chlamydomonas cf sp, Strain CCMP681" /NCGR_SAMPLE_ID=MMETSP1180 /ASSEMBLY_ACC=CAM_ASM_000741 /LENGTH=105 /DNA_ID=CAMNT_0007086527 /DNA_START=9 /DNA_END=326 /DNA_ORIENTATION=+